jgi:hypothetical protein
MPLSGLSLFRFATNLAAGGQISLTSVKVSGSLCKSRDITAIELVGNSVISTNAAESNWFVSMTWVLAAG